MKRVVQAGASGCGIACIAMLADKTYLAVKRVAVTHLGFDAAGPFYTYAADLQTLGSLFGVRVTSRQCRNFGSWAALPDRAIVAINPRSERRYWHWVLCVRDGIGQYVLDPRPQVKAEKRTDFGRMKPFGYLRVVV